MAQGVFWPRPPVRSDTARFYYPVDTARKPLGRMPGKGVVPNRVPEQSLFTNKRGALQGQVRSVVGRDNWPFESWRLMSWWGHFIKIRTGRRLILSAGDQTPMKGKRIVLPEDPGTVGGQTIDALVRDPREQTTYHFMGSY